MATQVPLQIATLDHTNFSATRGQSSMILRTLSAASPNSPTILATPVKVMTTPIGLTAVYEPVENGWTQARIEELPAVITAGPTVEDARELLLDALREYLLSISSVEHVVTEPREFSTRERLEIVLRAS